MGEHWIHSRAEKQQWRTILADIFWINQQGAKGVLAGTGKKKLPVIWGIHQGYMSWKLQKSSQVPRVNCHHTKLQSAFYWQIEINLISSLLCNLQPRIKCLISRCPSNLCVRSTTPGFDALQLCSLSEENKTTLTSGRDSCHVQSHIPSPHKSLQSTTKSPIKYQTTPIQNLKSGKIASRKERYGRVD